MKPDLTEKGALTSVIGILLFAFVGIMHEDLRHDTSAVAQHWQSITFWLMILGFVIFVCGAGIVYSTPMLGRK
ncbi:MAG: hypothetical protein WBB68_04175 [Candidatus Moraniibacteriota bacterium]